MMNFYQHTPVVVTGGAGFIGSTLVKKLVQLQARVTVIDDLSSGSMTNLQSVAHRITFVHASVTDLQTCITASAGNTLIIHLAAFVAAADSVTKPYQCLETNMHGTLTMLEAARRNNIGRFVFASSAAVYGAYQGLCSEDVSCKPESPYGLSKYIGELECAHYAKTYNIATVSLRYFNVYGDGQKTTGTGAGVVAHFKQRMRTNQPITIFGDGTQTRDFVPVDQIVNATLQAGIRAPALRGQHINVATGKSMSLLELYQHLKQEFPLYNKPLLFEPARAGDLLYSQANCLTYQKTLGDYMPEYSTPGTIPPIRPIKTSSSVVS